MLQTVFSDKDTDGSNGLEFSKLSTTKDKSDGDILFEKKYSDKSIDEHTVITEYAKWYMNTMNACCNRWQRQPDKSYHNKSNTSIKKLAS